MLLASLLEEEAIRSVLIVAPNTLLTNWAQEFRKWCPDVDIYKYHEGTEKKKLENLRAVQRRGGVLLTTFGLVQNHGEKLSHRGGIVTRKDEDKFSWDAILLDEAHKIKNPTKTTRAVHLIPGRFRVAITGTPIMNNLNELFNIFRWVFDGHLLPTHQQFKELYEKPITKSRAKDALPHEKSLGVLRGNRLRGIVEPYILRRTKLDIFGPGGDLSNRLTTKYDWVVWVKLTDDQVSMYMDYLNTGEVRRMVREADTMGGVLVKLTNLKKLCDHPFLLPSSAVCDLINKSRRTKNSNHLYTDLVGEEGLVDIRTIEESILIDVSAKMSCLIYLLEKLKAEGHRTLVFSQSTRLLDIIQKILHLRSFKLARLDGRVRMKDRDAIVHTFQCPSTKIDVMLLTTQVGGVGLTLTNADRVVIYDPSWNPAVDSQAIDRAYRIGQSRDVVVYRLITCGTVEEKIFRRQVFKGSVTRQVMNDGRDEDPTRYFTNSEIWELFQLKNPNESETWKQLNEMHGENRNKCPVTDQHRTFLISHDRVYNVSNHRLLFSVKNQDIMDDEAAKDTDRREGHQFKTATQKIYASNFDIPVPVRNNRPRVRHPNLDNPTEIDPMARIGHTVDKDIFADPTEVVDLVDSPLKEPRDSLSSVPDVSVDNVANHSMVGDRSIGEPTGVSLGSKDDDETDLNDDETELNDDETDLNSSIVSDGHASSAIESILLSDYSGSRLSGNASRYEVSNGDISNASISKANASNDKLNQSTFDTLDESLVIRRKKRSEIIISDDDEETMASPQGNSSRSRISQKGNRSVLECSSSGSSSSRSESRSSGNNTRMEDVSRLNLSKFLYQSSILDGGRKVSPNRSLASSAKCNEQEDDLLSDLSSHPFSLGASNESLNAGDQSWSDDSLADEFKSPPALHSTRHDFPRTSNKSVRFSTTASVLDDGSSTTASVLDDGSSTNISVLDESFHLHSSYYKTPTPTKMGSSDLNVDEVTPNHSPVGVFVTPSSVTTRKSKRSVPVDSFILEEATQCFSPDVRNGSGGARSASPEL